jgi:hypothetical protein
VAVVGLLWCAGTAAGQDVHHPFGSHPITYAAGAILPNHLSRATLDQSVRDFYDAWKAKYLGQVCGPGRYADGTESTPIHILKTALRDPDMQQMLVTWFNDKNPEYVESLRQAIASLPDIGNLQGKRTLTNKEVGADIINTLGLGNTLSAVMLTYPTLLIPFSAWLLMGYFKSVPRELEEAARIDGATRWQAMTRVVLPLCTPGLLSAGIFSFTLAQNEFLYALIFLTKGEVRTVPVGAITELIRGDVFYWGQLMAAALLGSIPVAIIYSFFVEHYVAGLTAGSVKS